MIRCLAVDDEAYASDIVAAYVAKVPFLELVGSTTSAIDALAQVQKGGIDLLFLDIQMPDLTGIQFLKLYNNACKVILTTAYPEYALDGYEHNVVDYLLKPIPFDRFLKAAQKAQQLIAPPPTPGANITSQAPDYLFIKGGSKNQFHKINYDDIVYIEGLKNYAAIYTTKQKIVTYQTLTSFEAQLPAPPFYRVHRSYIISIDKIKTINGNLLQIHDTQIPIGETYRDSFFKLLR